MQILGELEGFSWKYSSAAKVYSPAFCPGPEMPGSCLSR
jgi:hypothetical protein